MPKFSTQIITFAFSCRIDSFLPGYRFTFVVIVAKFPISDTNKTSINTLACVECFTSTRKVVNTDNIYKLFPLPG